MPRTSKVQRLLLSGTILVGSSWGAIASPAAATTARCEATAAGSELRYGVASPNAAFDPIGTFGSVTGGTENAAIWDVLFIYNEADGTVIPRLAESITSNDDFTVWTLTLREGITYSDGTPLDAQLVSDNIGRFLSGEGVRNAAGGYLSVITDRTVVDDLTLQLTLNAPFAEFPQVFTDEPGEIVNLNAIGDDLEAFRIQPPPEAGLGPYVVTSNIPGEETVLTARDDYWGGPVCIETIRFTFNPDVATTYGAFRNGELDVALLRDPRVTAQVEDDGVDGHIYVDTYANQILFNHREGRPTADPLVREAISLAIDPDIINERAFEGTLTAGTTFLSERSPLWSEAMVGLDTDVARATELAEQAKAEGWDGTVTLVGSNVGVAAETALAIEGMLAAVGITVIQQSVPPAEANERLTTGDFDLIVYTMPVGPDSAILATARFGSESPSNRMGYASAEMDEIIGRLFATPYAELAPVLAEVDAQVTKDNAFVRYGTTSDAHVWASNIEGLIITYSSVMLFHDAAIS